MIDKSQDWFVVLSNRFGSQEQQLRTEKIAAYESLYEREFEKEVKSLPIAIFSETTWNITMSAEKMLEDNKDFLIKAAELYGIDGRAIAGAIRWEYEVNWVSRVGDKLAFDAVQLTGEIDSTRFKGNGWGKMHYDTAQEVLKASGGKVPNNRLLAVMLALPTPAIDLIAKSMRQAVDAYWEFANVNISNKPEILATLYNNAGYFENYKTRALKLQGNPTHEGNFMGEWVYERQDSSLKDYKTKGRLFV